MKKIISFSLALIMTFAVASTTLAYDSSQTGSLGDNIDVYVTRIGENDLDEWYASSPNNLVSPDGIYDSSTNTSSLPDSAYVTTLAYAEAKASANPIMQRAFALLDDARAKGYDVHSMNIILPYNESQTSGNDIMANSVHSLNGEDPSDPNYWIENSYYWGTYQGQAIRYWFTSFSVSKPKSDVGSRPSTWRNVLSAVVKVAVDRLVGTTKFDTVYTAICDIQSVLGAATPANYTFDSATEWVRSETVGTLTYKDVLLEDIDNKVSGYAYYTWGSLQQLQFQTRFEVKYYAGLKNGSPDYPVVTSPYSASKYVRSRYYNDKNSLFPILRQYYNYAGYTMYSERVDLGSTAF